MPRFSHNNIVIIVANVIILEFLSARFVNHRLFVTILSFLTQVRA